MGLCFKLLSFLLILNGFGIDSHATINFDIELIDKGRGRNIPITLYEDKVPSSLPVIIINHGYGAKNTEYSFIAEKLASLG